MDGNGREGMTSFYLNRELSGSGNQTGGLHVPPPGFNTQSSLPSSMYSHSSFKMKHNSSPRFRHDMNTDGGGGGNGGVVSITTPGSGSDLVVKKKRGRPRKYTPESDESLMELCLTPTPLSASPGFQKKNKGRPPGSGWKQRLANVGEWMNNSAGTAFTPFRRCC